MLKRKKEIQKGFRSEMGILVDTTHEFGNTDDGNTARRFFKDIDTISRAIAKVI